MKIVINTRLLIKDKLEGIGWFIFETFKRICVNNLEHEFIFLFDRKFSEEFIFSDNIKGVVLNPPARHPVLWYIWYEISVKKYLKKEKPDLFISPDGFLSLSSKIKSIPVIHDINFFHRPLDLPFSSRFFYNKFFPKYARKAYKIVTVSQFSKRDISKVYNIDENKIFVVFNGCNTIYSPVESEIAEKTKLKYSNSDDYFIYIGSMHPRKNISRLLQAFEIFKTNIESDMKLLLVGERMFLTKEIDNQLNLMRFKDEVIFTGRLILADLHQVLASAFAMTFVPLYEGFGIPALEAMYCDVPVITSSSSSLPEVTGDAALYVNPNSVESISNAMEKIYSDGVLREKLIGKGRIQREKFSWDKTAENFWKVILESTKNA